MRPAAIFDALAADPALNARGIFGASIFEAQSVTIGDNPERPSNLGYFVVIDFQEQRISNFVNRGPRTMDVAVHVNWDITRSYAGIDAILNAIDRVLLPMEQVTGTDGVRVTCIRRTGRSRNLTDPGWRTITRYTTYSLLYDESKA